MNPKKNVDAPTATTRKPLFLFLLSGLFLLRAAQRTFLSLLLKAPPRSTRGVLSLSPQPSLNGLNVALFFGDFLPAAQQAADFGQHAGHMLILALRKPIPLRGQAQIKPHFG